MSAVPAATSVPETCRAVVLTEYKDFKEQDFTPKEIPTPTCGDDMVLVKTAVAAINPVDYKIVNGHISSWPNPVPLTPGYDVSGVVVKVGANVEGFAVGDEVFACNWGSNKETHLNNHADEGLPVAGALSEYVALPAFKWSKKPEAVSHEEAAGVALVGLTAHQAVQRLLGNDYAGKRILVLGGAGAVGYMACQLAKHGGATVYTTASSRTTQFVQLTGADKIVNYREVDWSEEEDLNQVDAVFDTTGEKDSFPKAKKILKEDGAFISIANFEVGFDPSAHSPLKFASAMLLRNDVSDQDLLASMIAAKTLSVPVNKRFEFTGDSIMEAFKTQNEGKSMGKNVVVF